MPGFFKINTKNTNFWLFFEGFSPKKPKFDKKKTCCVLIHHFSVLNAINFNISVHFSWNNSCYFQTK